MFTKEEKEKVVKYIEDSSEESKVYLGCDSKKYKRRGQWYSRYTVVVAIHIDGNHGCKVFGYDETEPDYEKNVKNPTYRLIKEVYKVCDLYLDLVDSTDAMIEREVEIHLDLNPNKRWASSKVVNQGVGYVLGVTGVEPKVKPDAWVASYAADHKVRYGDFKSSSRGSTHTRGTTH